MAMLAYACGRSGVHVDGAREEPQDIGIVVDCAFRTGMIPRRLSVDELFNDVTATLA
jgi:hypothetical protein